jgi:hypothetical protein
VEKAATRLLAGHAENVDPLIRRWLGEAVHYGEV